MVVYPLLSCWTLLLILERETVKKERSFGRSFAQKRRERLFHRREKSSRENLKHFHSTSILQITEVTALKYAKFSIASCFLDLVVILFIDVV